MFCYFKRIDTFATFGKAAVTDYSVPLGSSTGSTGQVIVVGELTQDYTRQWLIMGENLFYITAVSPSDGMTTVTVGDPPAAFSRTLVYSQPSTLYLGQYIADVLNSEFIGLSDAAYDMPYLSVSNSDTTSFSPEIPQDGLFTLESVMREAQMRGVVLTWTYTRTDLSLAISTAPQTTEPIVVGDGHTQLEEETYDKTAIAKVTVISELGYPHNYYLSIDGTISTSEPLYRAQGEWVTVKQTTQNLNDTAEQAFAANRESHKIAFSSDKVLGLSTPVLLRLNDQTYRSEITYVGIDAKDSRFRYRCGELATTLTEKISRLITATSVVSSSVDAITAWAPSTSATTLDIIDFARKNPKKLFCWAKYAVTSYTPVNTAACWTYTLYSNYSDDAYYVIFEAQNNTSGRLYRCDAFGVWQEYARIDDIPSVTSFNFSPNNTSTLTSQIDSAITANGVYSFYILSYGHQTATGMPTNANYYGQIFRGSATYITVMAFPVGSKNLYLLNKSNGTWGSWSQNS